MFLEASLFPQPAKESIVKSITCNLPDSLYEALQDRIQTDGASSDHFVSVFIKAESMRY